jgi:hypothetical protein
MAGAWWKAASAWSPGNHCDFSRGSKGKVPAFVTAFRVKTCAQAGRQDLPGLDGRGDKDKSMRRRHTLIAYHRSRETCCQKRTPLLPRPRARVKFPYSSEHGRVGRAPAPSFGAPAQHLLFGVAAPTPTL